MQVDFNSNTAFMNYIVSPARFTKAEAISFWSGAGEVNHFGFELTLSQNLPTQGKIVIAFPQFDGDVPIFDTDLGYGLASGSEIDCQSGTPTVLKDDSTASTYLGCKLIYPNLMGQTTIEVQNLAAMSAGDNFRFVLIGVTNPSTEDTAHV